MVEIRTPESPKEWENYYDLRYRILRRPWNQPLGSERTEDDDLHEHFALFENGQLLGVARLDNAMTDQEAQIRFVAVEENQQGKGLGKQLMQAIENYAKTKNVKTLSLQARENAVDFYTALGYELKTKTKLLFDVIQHYLMEKDIR